MSFSASNNRRSVVTCLVGNCGANAADGSGRYCRRHLSTLLKQTLPKDEDGGVEAEAGGDESTTLGRGGSGGHGGASGSSDDATPRETDGGEVKKTLRKKRKDTQQVVEYSIWDKPTPEAVTVRRDHRKEMIKTLDKELPQPELRKVSKLSNAKTAQLEEFMSHRPSHEKIQKLLPSFSRNVTAKQQAKRLSFLFKTRKDMEVLKSTNVIHSPEQKPYVNRVRTLEALLLKRPDYDEFKAILDQHPSRQTKHKRAESLELFLQSRPKQVELIAKNIMHGNPDVDMDTASSMLRDFFSHRPSRNELQRKNIFRENGQRMASLQSSLDKKLSARPSTTDLLGKNIILSDPLKTSGSIARRRKRLDFLARQASLDMSLKHRPALDSLVQMARELDTLENSIGTPRSMHSPRHLETIIDDEDLIQDLTDDDENVTRPETLHVDEIMSSFKRHTSNMYKPGKGSVFVWTRPNPRSTLEASPPELNPLSSLAGIEVLQISCGLNHTIMRCNKGRVFVWGENEYGQLGLGDYKKRHVPYLLAYEESALKSQKAAYVSAGERNSAVITEESLVYMFGDNSTYTLGVGDLPNSCTKSATPLHLHTLDKKEIASVHIGSNHAVALSQNGDLYSWGDGSVGQLGHPKCKTEKYPHLLHNFVEFFQTVACGTDFTTGLGYDHNVYVWGRNDEGQCGIRSEQSFQVTPKMVMSLWRKNVVGLSCSDKRILAYTDDGLLYLTNDVSKDDEKAGFTRLHPIHFFDSAALCKDVIVGAVSTGGVYRWRTGNHPKTAKELTPSIDGAIDSIHVTAKNVFVLASSHE